MLRSILLLFFLLQRSFADITTSQIVKYSDVLKVECDALPYRTVFYQANCYFAIDAATDSAATNRQCATVLPGAKLIGNAPEEVLARLFAQRGDFIQEGDVAKGKKAMCFYESAFPCAPNSPHTSTGTCSRLQEKKINVKDDQNNTTNVSTPDAQKIDCQIAYMYSAKLSKPMEINQTLHFKGIFSKTAAQCRFNLGNAAMTTYAMKLYISFGEGYLNLESKVNQKFSPGEMKKLPFKKGQTFDIAIQALSDRFQIYISGKPAYQFKYRMPLSTFTDIGMDDLQFISYAQMGEQMPAYPLIIGGEKGFPICKQVCGASLICKSLYITGIACPWDSSIAFTIYANKRGDNNNLALTFNYHWKQGEITVLNSRVNGKWTKTEGEIIRDKTKVFKRREPVEIRIVKEATGFQIFVNGTHFAHYPHRACPYNDELDIDVRGISEPVLTVK